MSEKPTGTVILTFGSTPFSLFDEITKSCGDNAIIDPTLAKMIGATFAIGSPELLDELRSKLATDD